MSEKDKVYMSFDKRAKDEDGLAKSHVVKETKTHFTLVRLSYNQDKSVLYGEGEITLPKFNEDGLNWFKANITNQDLWDSNQAKINRLGYTIARIRDFKDLLVKVKQGKATLDEVIKAVRILAKSDPEVAAKAEAMLVEALKA